MDESIRYQFFRHYFNTRQDEKIRDLLCEEGWQGYGIWWALLEFLGSNKDYRAKCDYKKLSWDLRADADIIKRVVENYGLFKVKNDYFWSESFIKQMDELTERYKRRAAAGAKGGRAKAMAKQSDGNMPSLLNEDRSDNKAMLKNKNSNAIAMQEQSHYNIKEENKVEKNRGDKKKKDIRDDISSSNESDNRHVVADDETRNFDDRVGDNTFMSIMRNYMYKGACAPTHEAIKLIDLMGPDWKTKDGRDFAGKEWEACCFWKVERDRKYIDAPRLSVNGCKGVDLFMEWMQSSCMYDQDVYNAFRGLEYDTEKKLVVLKVSDGRFVSLIEEKYIKQITPSFRRLFPGAKFEYQIFNML